MTGNTLIATGGIVATGAGTTARVTDNTIAGGGVVAEGGARLDLGQSFRIGGTTAMSRRPRSHGNRSPLTAPIGTGWSGVAKDPDRAGDFYERYMNVL